MLLCELFQPNHVAWLVQRLTKTMNMTPQQINNGWCGAFASRLARKLGKRAKTVSTTDLDGVFPGHRVVYYEGRYFDAESPEGVTDPKELAYSLRMRRIAAGEEDFSPEVYDA